jgi:uncharacterized membrane protein YfcA
MLFGFELNDILPYIGIGFAAQLVDGALGMAFGVIANTLLLALGLSPAAASANVHVIKVFTGAMSGISHILHKNVDWKLCARLSIAGVIGGVVGVQVITYFDSHPYTKPLILAYLTSIGLYILWRGIRDGHTEGHVKVVEPVGFAGGFLDASGGGGWGPVVTSNLLLQGSNPRMTVGTVNTAEFFLAIAISVGFIAHLGFEDFTVAVLGLLVGGLIAAPLGAWLTKHIPPRPLMIMVGAVLTLSSLFGIVKALKLI